ncbi:class II glutamine amidotransferase [Bradyrhizobium sp. CCBAU 051011]|uniref:class II glutamine amidotransferase n=1 Tax=Bradyrhizobium sp. CCBAU 051011 TaxID=858422 RepID=UPI00137457A9|nr:class II glutamine amidotransferase [Bradyrhizobium sp. CCBAU 051011]QHO75721.1 class II glutamine amidotransferase [Bradyrhizobium sp. CCBAU 051011]
MCELLGLSSNAPATVNVSLPKLAEHGRLSGTYNDGWGVGYYEGADVRLMKDSAAVGDSEWIQFIASHNLRSQFVIAHTRKATRGIRSYANAQPFVRELAGHAHLFAHNGDLPGILKSSALQADRFNPIGESDSELAFCALLDQMAAIWTVQGAVPTLRQRFLIVSSFAGELRKLGPANFLYSDGDMLFAHGHRRKHAETGKIEAPGLVSIQRQCQQDTIGLVASGLSIRGDNQQVTLFASVPLTNEFWVPLAEGELVAARGGQIVARQLVDQAMAVSDTFCDNQRIDKLGVAAD